jgi:hypothetical protein
LVFQQHGDALAAADAGGGDAVAELRALEFTRENGREAEPGRGEWVADGDGAAVDVDFVAIELQLMLDEIYCAAKLR